MNTIEKSKSIWGGLRKGFQNGKSKLAQGKCCGYDVGPDRELTINPDEAATVRWIFDQYTSTAAVEVQLPPAWKKKVSYLPLKNQNGTERHSISCSPMKNIRGGCCSRKLSAQELPK